MPLSVEEIDEIESTQGGSGLRRKLEETIGENRQLAEKVFSYEANEVIAAKGFSLVKPEDLVGAENLEARAQELQEARETERLNVVRDLLAQKGLEGEELDSAVAEFVSAPKSSEGSATDAAAELSSLRGKRPPVVRPEQMTTAEKWAAAIPG